jgi:hypothetical protein
MEADWDTVYRLAVRPEGSASFSPREARIEHCIVRCGRRVSHGQCVSQRFHIVAGDHVMVGVAPWLEYGEAAETYRDAMPGHGALLPPCDALGAATERPGVMLRCDGLVVAAASRGWAPPPSGPVARTVVFPPGSVVVLTIDRCSCAITAHVEGTLGSGLRPTAIATLDPTAVAHGTDLCFVAASPPSAREPAVVRLLSPADAPPATDPKLVNEKTARNANYFGLRSQQGLQELERLALHAV